MSATNKDKRLKKVKAEMRPDEKLQAQNSALKKIIKSLNVSPKQEEKKLMNKDIKSTTKSKNNEKDKRIF